MCLKTSLFFLFFFLPFLLITLNQGYVPRSMPLFMGFMLLNVNINIGRMIPGYKVVNWSISHLILGHLNLNLTNIYLKRDKPTPCQIV